MVGPLFAPRLMQQRVMILGVVGDDDYAATSSETGTAKAFEEGKEGHPIELARLAAEVEFSIPQSHSAKVSDIAPCGSVQQNGIFGFRRDPHLTAGTMLLKVHFVDRPEVHRR